MYHIIDESLQQEQFGDFSAFAEAALNQDKVKSLESTLSIALRATSIGQAFAVAYRCALQVLLPSLNQAQWAALCVSEPQGNHPKKLKTLVSPQGLITGYKSFVTMAQQASQLIVIAKATDNTQALLSIEGRPILKAVLLKQPTTGIVIKEMPEMNLVPDIRHGQIELDNAQGIILPGDGHNDYSKYFRYLEDVHVLMAFVSLMLSTSVRHQLEPEINEKCLVLIASVLAQDLKDASWQHLFLAGAFSEFKEIVARFEGSFHNLPQSFVDGWQRDKKLFTLAAKARLARTEKARLWLLSRTNS